MTAENALDPPPVRRRAGKVPYPRIAGIVAGVVVAAAAIFAIVHIATQHPETTGGATRAGFERGGASSSQTPQAPPAVTPQTAAQTRANLDAMQRAANAPGLAARSVQVATVSPPGGRAPSGVGVTNTSVGSSDG